MVSFVLNDSFFNDQNKKNYPKKKQMHYFGWRGETAETDTQIGQLLYYLTAVQQRRLQAYIECQSGPPSVSSGPPAPVLGLFMEAEMVCVCK